MGPAYGEPLLARRARTCPFTGSPRGLGKEGEPVDDQGIDTAARWPGWRAFAFHPGQLCDRHDAVVVTGYFCFRLGQDHLGRLDDLGHGLLGEHQPGVPRAIIRNLSRYGRQRAR